MHCTFEPRKAAARRAEPMLGAGLGGLLTLTIAASPAAANMKVLYSFTGGSDGEYPMAGLTADGAGGFYGTTSGVSWPRGTKCGTVFHLSAGGTLTTLHNFTCGADGGHPDQSLILRNGILYGVTPVGGDPANSFDNPGNGLVFALAADGSSFTVVHIFIGGTDGAVPEAPLIMDSAGNIYGTTLGGGDPAVNFGYGYGTVFKIAATGEYTVLHAFTGSTDGCWPMGGVILDGPRGLVGTTSCGGAAGQGNVFALHKDGSNSKFYDFNLPDAPPYKCSAQPAGNFVKDSIGNIYGITSESYGCGFGSIYRIAPDGSYTDLHEFTGGADGKYLSAGKLLKWPGNSLVGVTGAGGTFLNWGQPYVGSGMIFRLMSTGQLNVLYTFTAPLGNGYDPSNKGNDPVNNGSGLISDPGAHHIYGTTLYGGTYDYGEVFEFTPCAGECPAGR